MAMEPHSNVCSPTVKCMMGFIVVGVKIEK